MIFSFACRETEKIFNLNSSRKLPGDIVIIARRKLQMVHYAHDLKDLRSPPGNRLEALKGDRKGQYSICINQQFRICFIWRDGNAYEVEIIDYH